jgi:Isochorismatase family
MRASRVAETARLAAQGIRANQWRQPGRPSLNFPIRLQGNGDGATQHQRTVSMAAQRTENAGRLARSRDVPVRQPPQPRADADPEQRRRASEARQGVWHPDGADDRARRARRPAHPAATGRLPRPEADQPDLHHNTWQDERVVGVVTATGRKKLIIAGLYTEICVAMPTLQALGDSYEVYVVTDASGGVSPEAHAMAVRRMVQAGAVPLTWDAFVGDLQRDWPARRPSSASPRCRPSTAAAAESRSPGRPSSWPRPPRPHRRQAIRRSEVQVGWSPRSGSRKACRPRRSAALTCQPPPKVEITCICCQQAAHRGCPKRNSPNVTDHRNKGRIQRYSLLQHTFRQSQY